MDLKTKYAKMRLDTAANQLQQIAKLNEISGMVRLAGSNPALWDYPAGFALCTAQTTSAPSTATFRIGKDANNTPIMVRFAATIGATPTCTYAIQGSLDSAFTAPIALAYCDSQTPDVFVSTTFVITTNTTVIKVIKSGQSFHYLRVLFSANTNVTNTVDVMAFGDV